jgi:hypothetical protein
MITKVSHHAKMVLQAFMKETTPTLHILEKKRTYSMRPAL